MTPQRIQRKRTRGWRMPEGAVYVGRPSKWGNPYTAPSCPRSEAVALFRDMLDRAPLGNGHWGRVGETVQETIRRELVGKDLACWCPLDQPCHADVLLELANAPTPTTRGEPECQSSMKSATSGSRS
jgi:hypothetical protein